MTALMPRLFTDLADWFETDFPSPARHMIRVEEKTGDRDYTVRAELPGVDPAKDIDVSVDDGIMTIRAERREHEETKGRSEFRYGMLRRSVWLPSNADSEHITATYDQGVLEVTVPLTEPEQAGRKIPVTTGS